ncbi:MAG: hypothetical protein HY092_03070 [Candidatus Kerfeldbacteria bacterium]|nr:hypothetical protein [Candidatus Kerfeldbacteria bacterium]
MGSLSRVRQRLGLAVLSLAVVSALALPVKAATPIFTTIWYNGQVVRTILPPSAMPKDGTDPFYMVPGTGGVAAVAPGSTGYHGGHWKVYVVSWHVAQYPLRSEAAIWAAAGAGDVTVTRNAALDFLCPIQP